MAPDELPVGMAMAMAMDPAAMERFAALPEAERQTVVDGARAVRSRDEMRAYLNKTLGAR